MHINDEDMLYVLLWPGENVVYGVFPTFESANEGMATFPACHQKRLVIVSSRFYE